MVEPGSKSQGRWPSLGIGRDRERGGEGKRGDLGGGRILKKKKKKNDVLGLRYNNINISLLCLGGVEVAICRPECVRPSLLTVKCFPHSNALSCDIAL